MSTTFVDAHVHFHSCFQLTTFVEAAWTNLVRAMRVQQDARQPIGCLLLAQICTADPLEELRNHAAKMPTAWELCDTSESDAVVFARHGVPTLAIVAGRQLVTAEGLELLALATGQRLPSGRPMVDSVQATVDSGGIPVVPWGFGKWWFQRGAELKRFLHTQVVDPQVLLGDNGCRPRGFGVPELFDWGIECGFRVLAGTDPLPWPDHQHRVASYGSILPGEIDWARPTAWVRRQIAELRTPPATFGRCRNVGRFVHDQLRVHLHKWERP